MDKWTTFTSLDELIQHNVETIARIERAGHDSRTASDRFADIVSAFCGRIGFVWVHCVWFVLWLLVNATAIFPAGMRFDPPPFPMLTLIVSLEAIFLSTFILISQNHQQHLGDKRNHLDLQINLLAEQENSQMLTMLHQIMERLNIEGDRTKQAAMRETTDPEHMVKHIERSTGNASAEDAD